MTALFSIQMVLEYTRVYRVHIYTHMYALTDTTQKCTYELPHEIKCRTINKAAQVSNGNGHLKVVTMKRDF